MQKVLKDKICKCCKKPFKPYNPLQQVCNIACAIELNKTKEKKQEAVEWKLKRKKIVEKLKTLSDYEKEAKTVFQKWIRMRDSGLCCISCGTTQSSVWDASHYFSAGQYSGLIFSELNVHLACGKCNRFLHGNLIGYRLGLINRYGILYVQTLEDLAIQKRNYKYTKQELIDIKTKYQKWNTNK